LKIQDKNILITGANRGIGYCLVEAFLKAGANKVYATARNIESLSKTIELAPNKVIPLELDVTDYGQIRELPAKAPDINMLVNNAGILAFGGILDLHIDEIAGQFATNFYGPLNMSRAFVPTLEKNGDGAIVNIITLLALASFPPMACYNASKAANWSMTQSLRATLASKNIAVFGVFPGTVNTDLIKGVELAKTSPADVASAIVSGIQLDQEDIFPDPMSTQTYAAWKQDHKAVEKQFAAMA